LKTEQLLDWTGLFAVHLQQTELLSNRNLTMPGQSHYQPTLLPPYLGYDQWACYCALVEWVWLLTLGQHKIMPKGVAKLLTPALFRHIVLNLSTTAMTKLEREKTHHDIIALTELMSTLLPEPLRKWLHFGLTSYDVMCTAYAVQLRVAHKYAFAPLAREVDEVWRERIAEYASAPRLGLTHLQAAIPVTVGSWLGKLHHSFVGSARSAEALVQKIPGKFSGAVGNRAGLSILFGAEKARQLERSALRALGLPEPVPCHQETPPEPTSRFYDSVVSISAVLANLGDDIRHLQSTWVGEVQTPGSRSSAMPHKRGNPIGSENTVGMYRSVVGEKVKQLLNQTTNLERDLCDSSVMRGYSAMLVFTAYQLNTMKGVLDKLQFVTKRAEQNLKRFGKIVSAEALHLALKLEGETGTHAFLNEVLVPKALRRNQTIFQVAEAYANNPKHSAFKAVWGEVLGKHPELAGVLKHPETYLGTSAEDAHEEWKNVL